MGRAELRRTIKNEKKVAVTYNLTKAQLDAMVRGKLRMNLPG